MINLLPDLLKLETLYARRNSYLFHWSTALLVTLFGTVIIVAAGYLYLERAIVSQRKSVETTQATINQKEVADTQKKIADISNNTKLATQVLSKEVLFSELLKQLGSALPNNTALSQLRIDGLQGGITLAATAADINAATQIQVNLQDPRNKIFDKADIDNIECAAQPAPNQIYPCTVQIRALFAKDNPFLYITPTAPTPQAPQGASQ